MNPATLTPAERRLLAFYRAAKPAARLAIDFAIREDTPPPPRPSASDVRGLHLGHRRLILEALHNACHLGPVRDASIAWGLRLRGEEGMAALRRECRYLELAGWITAEPVVGANAWHYAITAAGIDALEGNA